MQLPKWISGLKFIAGSTFEGTDETTYSNIWQEKYQNRI
jgi:hypothetical protein